MLRYRYILINTMEHSRRGRVVVLKNSAVSTQLPSLITINSFGS